MDKFLHQYVNRSKKKLQLCRIVNSDLGDHVLIEIKNTNQSLLVEKDYVSRCTHVKDKEGNVLFEHDIVKIEYKDENNEVIETKNYRVIYRNDIGAYRFAGLEHTAEMSMFPLNNRAVKTGNYLQIV